MKASKRLLPVVLALAVVATTTGHPRQLSGQTSPTQASAVDGNSHRPLWSLEVKTVDPGDVSIAASFQIAIYESLLDEISKTKQFKKVFRDGDRNVSDVSDLLILKTTVEKYSAGSETQRAVTTVSGATKLTVRSQLCTRDGRILLERTVNGDVRFMGSNLRATHNLARNVAKTIKQSPLPVPSMSATGQSGQL